MRAKKSNNQVSTALLYRISKAMAAVKDGRELLKIIVAETQQLFDFYDIGLSVIDKSRLFYVDWAVLYQEISPSEASLAMAENNLEKFSVDEPLYKYALAIAETENKPFVIDATPEFFERFKEFPHFPIEVEYGYKQFLVTTLRFGDKTLGVLNFNSQKENHFDDCDLELFQAVADLIAIAVANITANEEILEREREKSKLLSISREIATVQTRKQLLNVIFTTIKDIFPYDDAGLFYFCDAGGRPNPNGQYYVHLLDDLISEVNTEIAEQNITGVLSVGVDGVRFHAKDQAFITTLDQLIEDFPGHPFFPIMERDGIRQFITKGIKIGGETIGMLSFNSRHENFYSEKDFPLFDNIVNQVAVALANILANEEIIEREREKSVLLSISQAIATIQNTEQLFKIIFERIQPIFGFYDVGLFVLSNDGNHITDWATTHTEMSPSIGNHQIKQLQMETLLFEGSPLQYVFNQLLKSDAPRIFQYDLTYFDSMADTAFREKLESIIEKGGYREFLATTLKTGGKILGLLFFNAKTSGFFNAEKFGLFQAVADQIAVAVANITANEEIIERESEKSRLLEITELIAQVKANDDLLRLIVDKIRPLFGFEDCGLFVVSADKKTHRDLAAAIPGVSPSEFNERIAAIIPAHDLPHSGSVVEAMMREIQMAGKPVLLDFVDLVEQFPDYPQFIGTGILDLGYRDCLAANLVVRGEPIGMFCVNALRKDFFQPQIFPLFQAVAHSISIAVANILANEEILERIREKSILLSISEDIASARNAVELMQVIRGKAQKLIPFSDTGILIVEADGEHHYDLAVNLQGWDESAGNKKLHALGLTRIKHPDSYLDFVMQLMEKAKSPIIEDYEARSLEFDYPFFSIMNEIGTKEGIGTTLKSGGKTFGTFWINSLEKNHFKPEQFEVFQALANQVAVAVSNILANDEIKKQLTEITELKKRLEEENTYLVEEVSKNYNFAEIIGTSPRLKEVFEIIETVAPTDATVLIQGETGTGKELIARAVHNRSNRNERPLIKVNCATLPRDLVESELFGHERGAFTGATEKRLGKFELAHNGTIFLDEIGELPLEMQVKLLRVLQEKEIERLGGKGAISLDLRVVAATNRNLAQEVQAGRFRADLYYRLCTVELFMSRLRERKEDIEPLTMYFAKKYASKFSRSIESISSKMLSELQAYDFPGNIRELEHIVEHAVIFSKDEKLILPRSLTMNLVESSGHNSSQTTHEGSISLLAQNNETRKLLDVEREHIITILRQTEGRIKGKQGAAEILGLNPASLYFRMKKLAIDKNNLYI